MFQKVIAKDLKIGMFVADLDRPWMDTPFLLQGFMLEDSEQIQQVQLQCQWVMIDPMHSTGPDFDQKLKKKEPPPKRDLGRDPILVVHRTETPKPKAVEALRIATGNLGAKSSNTHAGTNASKTSHNAAKNLGEFAIPISQHDVKTDTFDPMRTSPGLMPSRNTLRNDASSSGSKALRGMFGQLKLDVKNLFSSAPKDKLDFEQYHTSPQVKAEVIRPSFIPETVQLTIYEDKQTVESEVNAATNAFAKTQELLNSVI
ncbi:MAG: DUF3391 domain-containing protein, partial [Pseudomonadota bacterium]